MPVPLKLKFPQDHVPPERMHERLKFAKLYILMTHTFNDMAFPDKTGDYGASLEALLVWLCVFIGDAEGRPTTPTKIATHAGMPRASVYRHLGQLQKLRKIVKVGRSYHIAPGSASPDDRGRIAKILASFLGN